MDERGVPLSIVVTGANRHDVSQLEAVLDAIIVDRPIETEENLCADKGYCGEPARRSIEERSYRPNIKPRNEEAEAKKLIDGYKPRRWIVEVAHSWFNRFRKLLVRYEKLLLSYEALLQLAASIICWRKVGVIYG